MDKRPPIEPGEIRKTIMEAGLQPEHMPRHIAVIMDGNGRWASARGLPHIAGHRAGTEAVRRLVEASLQLGIPHVTIYAFSTENWKRPPIEVRGLLYMIQEVIDRQLDELDANGVQVRHVGWMDRVPRHLAESIARAVARTSSNDRLILAVAFNYGGRQELARAMRRIAQARIAPEDIDEACIERHLETVGLPDPDLVVRTSGEMRWSNFLLWQAAYSEFYCTDTLWPDFDRSTLVAALDEYRRRERRFGGRLGSKERQSAPERPPGAATAAGRAGGALG